MVIPDYQCSEQVRLHTMEINALLCDHAQVAGKLYVSGAGIDSFYMAPNDPGPYVINFAIAGIVHVPWTATNQEHKLEFRVVDGDGQVPALGENAVIANDGLGGEMSFNLGRPAGLPSGDDQSVPFAFQFYGLPLTNLGRYVVDLSIDGSEMSHIPFRVTKLTTVVGYGPATPGSLAP